MNIVALAGGVGGAKLADGLAQILPPEKLTIIVNTGDDFEHWGLKICPDLDTVCYTLAGLANTETGWGRSGESWHALESIAALGGDDWFRIGDRDLGTHIERTRRMRAGEPLSQVTAAFCQAWGIQATILPMSDDVISTIVSSDQGVLAFQEYFVHRRCEPQVNGFCFAGVERAQPAPGVLEAVENADVVVFCPSNPWVSIGPILALPTLRSALSRRLIVAVSPIIRGQAVKGPAAKMYRELGIQPSALAVAQHFYGLLTGYVFDSLDADQEEEIAGLGMQTRVTDTLMKDRHDRRRLAEEVLQFCGTMISDKI